MAWKQFLFSEIMFHLLVHKGQESVYFKYTKTTWVGDTCIWEARAEESLSLKLFRTV